jgi:hypothetical protein
LTLLRSSEYCVSDIDGDGSFDSDQTLLDGDVMLLRGDTEINWASASEMELAEATEVVIAIKKSKTDQGRQGVTRGAEKTSNPEVCAVRAVVRWILARRKAKLEVNDCMPFFRWGNTKDEWLRRDLVAKAVKKAGVTMGHAAQELDTHSLRIGGATSLIHQGVDVETVRRFGRWLSDCWRLYTFTTRERISGLSDLMATSKYTLELSSADFHAARRNMTREDGTATPQRSCREAGSPSKTVPTIDTVREGALSGSEWFDVETGDQCKLIDFSFVTYADGEVVRVGNFTAKKGTGRTRIFYSTVAEIEENVALKQKSNEDEGHRFNFRRTTARAVHDLNK